jgi:hypothetical protein
LVLVDLQFFVRLHAIKTFLDYIFYLLPTVQEMGEDEDRGTAELALSTTFCFAFLSVGE